MDKQSFQHQFPNQFSHPFPPLLCYQKYDISYCDLTLPLNLKTQRRFSRFTAVNHNYGDNRPTTKIHKMTKWISTTEYKQFSRGFPALIDGSEKYNGSLNLELQSPHVIGTEHQVISTLYFDNERHGFNSCLHTVDKHC